MLAVSFYEVVLTAHVAAVVFAFGALFAYPWLPGGTPAAHDARRRLLSVVVERGALLALVFGLYLAVDADVFGEVWVMVPLGALVAIGGLVGSVMIPGERRLADPGLAEPGRAEVERRVRGAALGSTALVLVALFFMVTKAGG